jgi:hypothetical protein
MTTSVFAETLENLQYYTWHIPESQSHILQDKIRQKEGKKDSSNKWNGDDEWNKWTEGEQTTTRGPDSARDSFLSDPQNYCENFPINIISNLYQH